VFFCSLKLNASKEDFEEERKDYSDQLQIMRNKMQLLEQQFQEKVRKDTKAPLESQIAMHNTQVINLNCYDCSTYSWCSHECTHTHACMHTHRHTDTDTHYILVLGDIPVFVSNPHRSYQF